MPGVGKAIVYSDGASRGNPGEAGAGVVFFDSDGGRLGEISVYLGRRTNNQAEYMGLLLAILGAYAQGMADAEFRLDSELAVRQLNGEYRIKDAELRDLANRVREACAKLDKVAFVHVPRSRNREADRLANAAIDSRRADQSQD